MRFAGRILGDASVVDGRELFLCWIGLFIRQLLPQGQTLRHAKEAAAALREDNAWLTRQLRDARRTMAVTKAVEESGTGVAAKKPGQG